MKPLTLLLVLLAFVSVRADAQQRTIGAILPLTGDLASIGQELRRGIELARADAGTAGVDVVFEDDKTFDKHTAVTAASKLIERDKVRVLLNGAVNTMKAIDSVVSKGGAPAIVLWDNNRSLEDLSPHTFSIGYSTEAAGEDMAQHAKGLNARTIAVVSAEDEWSEVLSRAFVDRAKQIDLTVISHDRVAAGETNLKAITSRILSKAPAAIYLPVNPPTVGTMIRRLREAKYGGAILTADGFGENEIKELGDFAEGVAVTQILVAEDSLHAKYARAYGAAASPLNLGFVALGYDGYAVAHGLLKKADAEKISVTAAAKEFSHTGYTGDSKLNRDSQYLKREGLARVSGGKLVRVP